MNEYPSRTRLAPIKRCGIRGCRSHPGSSTARMAVRGADICEAHAFRFADALAELVRVYRDLERSLTKTTSLKEATVDTSGHADVGTMWNPAAASVLADLNDVVRNVVGIVNDDRPDGPHIADPANPLLQLEVLRRRHARWLALYPTLGIALLAEATHLHSRALDAIDTPAVRRVILPGRGCAHIERHPDFGEFYCGAPLFGITTAYESRIVCSLNPEHTVEREDWIDHA